MGGLDEMTAMRGPEERAFRAFRRRPVLKFDGSHDLPCQPLLFTHRRL